MKNYLQSKKFSQLVHPHLRKMGRSVVNCSKEASDYTSCCTTKGLNINQYDCQKEFEKLIVCVRKQMKSLK